MRRNGYATVIGYTATAWMVACGGMLTNEYLGHPLLPAFAHWPGVVQALLLAPGVLLVGLVVIAVLGWPIMAAYGSIRGSRVQRLVLTPVLATTGCLMMSIGYFGGTFVGVGLALVGAALRFQSPLWAAVGVVSVAVGAALIVLRVRLA